MHKILTASLENQALHRLPLLAKAPDSGCRGGYLSLFRELAARREARARGRLYYAYFRLSTALWGVL